MKGVVADFARQRRPDRGLWLALALLVLAAAVVSTLAWRERAKVEALRAAIEHRRLHAEASRQASTIAAPPPYEASAQELLRERSVPWPQALTALESVAIVGVTPSAIEIAPREGAVHVELEFTDHQRLHEYVEALNAGLTQDEVGWRWALIAAQTPPGATGTARLRGNWRDR